MYFLRQKTKVSGPARFKSDKAPTQKASADEWVNKGAVLVKSRHPQEALQCFDKALEIDPKNVIVWTNKGLALGLLGRDREAIQCFDKALEIDPKNAFAQRVKRKIMFTQRRLNGRVSILLFSSATKTSSEWPHKQHQLRVLTQHRLHLLLCHVQQLP
jgi:tetratricopeptide (TPR) repeat protein